MERHLQIHQPGDRFGMLVCIRATGEKRHFHATYLWKCDCGNEHIGYIQKGTKKPSCGCATGSSISAGKIRHSHAHDGASLLERATYRAWCNIRKRCANPSDKHYVDYGGRGIAVCERWQCYENFLEDMGVKPDASLSIERDDVNGNYEPGNCRWATDIEQARNKRNSNKVEFNGIVACIAEWSERSGLKRETIRNRIKRGWSPERAITEPLPTTGKGSYWRKIHG